MEQRKDYSVNDIMLCLGKIEGRLTEMASHGSRQTYALIGVIAAQIGVKVLGTDPFLDIATFLALLGAVLLLGCLVAGVRLIKNGRNRVTRTGLWLTILVCCIILVQMGVYFRDLGIITPRVIYILRIVQNGVTIMFAWNLMHNARIFKDKPPSC